MHGLTDTFGVILMATKQYGHNLAIAKRVQADGAGLTFILVSLNGLHVFIFFQEFGSVNVSLLTCKFEFCLGVHFVQRKGMVFQGGQRSQECFETFNVRLVCVPSLGHAFVIGHRIKIPLECETMTMPPTKLERFLKMRIHLWMFGRYIGTGHLSRYDTDTESDSESDFH